MGDPFEYFAVCGFTACRNNTRTTGFTVKGSRLSGLVCHMLCAHWAYPTTPLGPRFLSTTLTCKFFLLISEQLASEGLWSQPNVIKRIFPTYNVAIKRRVVKLFSPNHLTASRETGFPFKVNYISIHRMFLLPKLD